MSSPDRPVRVAILNDYEVVVAGLAAILGRYAGRVEVVEVDSSLPLVSDVDVVLYDTFGQVQGAALDLESRVSGQDVRVIIYSWNLQPELVQASLDAGAAGYVSKGLGADDLVHLIEQVHAGKTVVPSQTGTTAVRGEAEWPGRSEGLSAREAEIVALISQGLSNKEVAERSYLSINSVKTYIRSAYRKMGVTSRSQAVLWGVQHGFQPDISRWTGSQVPD